MSFCPKCNTIYDNDITICEACNEFLLKGTPDDYKELLVESNEETALKTFNYIKDSGYDEVVYYLDLEGCYHILVNKNDYSNINELLILSDTISFSPESEDDFEAEIIDENEDLVTVKINNIKPYVKMQDKYEDYRSSAVSLLFVGVAGLALLILQVLGVISLPFIQANHTMLYIVMGAMFTIFSIAGLLSWLKSTDIKPLIAKEEKLTKNIKEYINENYTRENDSNDDDINNYYNEYAKLKHMITSNFDVTDESYLDYIIEDIYSTFEK